MLGQGKKSNPPQHVYNSHLHIHTCPVSLSIITCPVPMGKLRRRETRSLGRLIRTKSTYSLSVMHKPRDLLSTILIFCYQCLHFFSEEKNQYEAPLQQNRASPLREIMQDFSCKIHQQWVLGARQALQLSQIFLQVSVHSYRLFLHGFGNASSCCDMY